jgi:hypothetical protein
MMMMTGHPICGGADHVVYQSTGVTSILLFYGPPVRFACTPSKFHPARDLAVNAVLGSLKAGVLPP